MCHARTQRVRQRPAFRAAALLSLAFAARSATAEPPEPVGTLTLDQAIALALAANPELQAAAAEAEARGGLALQAGALPNPELQGDLENFGGSGVRRGLETAESTLRLSQRFELGGKRAARRRVAMLDRDLADWDYAGKRLTVRANTAKAFATTLAAQDRLRLGDDLIRIARETLATVDRGVRAGAAAAVDVSRARVALGRATLERGRAAHELDTARTLLAATWGAGRASFTRADGDLAVRPPLPREAALLDALADNPDLARFGTERAERRAALAAERAKRIPDLTVGAGARHFSDNGDDALVVELVLPLPLFDRNRGGILAAHHRLAGTDATAAAAHVAARAALTEARQRARAADEAATQLERDLLPQTRTALRDATDALRHGLLRPDEVFATQRSYVELQIEYIRTLEAFHLAAAEVERLCAAPLPALVTAGGGR